MTAAAAPSLELPPVGTYRVDPGQSSVAFHGRHMFGLGPVHAAFSVVTGQVTVSDPPESSSVDVTVDASSFRSDKTRRDEHVRSAALLDVERYPEITFQSTSLRRDADRWVLDGYVTAHGTSVPVELAVTGVTPQDGGYRFTASAQRLDRYAFDVTKVKGMAGRYLDLEVDALALPD